MMLSHHNFLQVGSHHSKHRKSRIGSRSQESNTHIINFKDYDSTIEREKRRKVQRKINKIKQEM